MGTTLQDIIMKNINYCEEPKNRIIRECKIVEKEHMNEVWVKSSIDGDFAEDQKLLFSYYADELNFSEDEFIGKTEYEGTELFHIKDTEYLKK